MNKKSLLYISFAVVGLLIVVVGVLMFTLPSDEPATETPSASTETNTPVPPSGNLDAETERLTALAETNQYTEGNQVDTKVNSDNLGVTSPVYIPLAVWTANQYVENAIANPYFVSGYWETVDGYKPAAVKKYVTPYVTETLNTEFLNAAAEPGTETFNNFYKGKVFLPASGLTIPPQCAEKWVEDACYTLTPPPALSDVVITGISANSLRLEAKVTVNAIYYDPNKPEGSLMIQPQVYNVNLVLEETNVPNQDNKPIMVITEISSTLDIKDNVDYITNVGE